MISVFITTCGRTVMLADMLDSLFDTTAGTDVEVNIVIDEDYDSWDVAYNRGCGVWFRKNRQGALQGWNDALKMCKGDILVPAGDDQVFHSGWLDYSLESHKDKLDGYGVVGMNDLAYDGNTQVATMFLFDRQYCKDHMGGIFAPPVYKYFCVDSEWNEKAKSLGRFYWDERAKVEHLHSAHGKRPVDDLDLEKQGWMEEDNKTFEERKVHGFPITWQPII